jgi:hypothetical protein
VPHPGGELVKADATVAAGRLQQLRYP